MPGRASEHRLAAIVVADVVGYTRLMEKDESGTLMLLQAVRADVVDPTTAKFGGRIVKSTGDGWLAEFSSVTDAVRSSLEIQDALAWRNARADEARRVEFRIGVNLGEIAIEGDDIYGTGVNIAARLEALADPGSVVVSNAVHATWRCFRFATKSDSLSSSKGCARQVCRNRSGRTGAAPRVLFQGAKIAVPTFMTEVLQ